MGMATVPRAHRSLDDLLGDPPVVRWTTRYLKRLLIERSAIRARLENPGGSIILMATEQLDQSAFSPVVGNDFHLDLIEAETEVNNLPLGDRIAILEWVHSLTPAQMEEYLDVRGPVKRRSLQRQAERKAEAIVETLSAREDA